jgi:thioredoxin reductase (NADPH)
MNQKIYPVCVIGGGSAGTMAVLRTLLNNDECLFFPGSPKDKKRSRDLWVRKIENIPGYFHYKRGIQEPNIETMKWIADSPFKENLYIQKNTGVTSLKKSGDIFEIIDSKDNVFHAQFVILCTGVMDVQPEIKGTIETVYDYANAQTIDYCLICDGHHVMNKKTSVIGHTNGAAWVSIMLHERYQPKEFKILTNGKKTEFQADTQKLLDLYGIKVCEAAIIDIVGQDKGKILEGFTLEDGTHIETDICFISLGMIVYNELAKQAGAELDERGFVKAEENGLTSVSGLYVAGDLKAGIKKQIYTAWDSAVNSANAINQIIRLNKRQQLQKD